VTQEGVSDDLFELLPAERRDVLERVLAAEAPRPDQNVDQGGKGDRHHAGAQREQSERDGHGC
jgi:hypothetical protein